MCLDARSYFDMDIKIFQKTVYNFLERPSRGWICFAYHFFVKNQTLMKINLLISHRSLLFGHWCYMYHR
jgi:hypothetical protein